MSHPAAPSRPTSRFAGDVAFTLGSRLLYLATRLVIPPLVLAQVSLAEYGIWTVSFILVSYLGLTAAGFSSVYVRAAAQGGSTAELSRVLSTGMGLTLGISAVVLLVLWWGLPALLAYFHVPAGLQHHAFLLTFGACGIFLADLSLGGYAYLLHGIGHLRDEQKIWVAAFMLEFVCVLAMLAAGWGIVSLLLAFAVRYAFSIGAAAWRAHQLLPGLRCHPQWFCRRALRQFGRFGLAVQGSSLFSTLLHSSERVLAGLLLGPQATALFDLANKLPSTAMSLPSAVATVTLPAAAQPHAELADLHRRSTRLCALLTALPMPLLCAFSTPLLVLWLGPRDDLVDLAFIMLWLTPACHLHILTGPGSAVFRGIGRVANEYVYHGLRLLALLLCVPLALRLGGLAPAPLAVGLSVATMSAALAYLWWNFRQFGDGVALWRQVLPSLIFYPLALLLAQSTSGALLSRGDALWALLGGGMAYAMLALPLFWWLLQPAERARIHLQKRSQYA